MGDSKALGQERQILLKRDCYIPLTTNRMILVSFEWAQKLTSVGREVKFLTGGSDKLHKNH